MKKKRHHFVPISYLNSFRNDTGKIWVYRKDSPLNPIPLKPENTGFHRYYYSQPIGNGDTDFNSLEDIFSEVESAWPKIAESLENREFNTDQLKTLFSFIGMQRVRVPAFRNAWEKMQANDLKVNLRRLVAEGEIPKPPKEYPNLVEQSEIAIDPHRSIHAMIPELRNIGPLLDRLGYVAIHNKTDQKYLTSDNPVAYYDATLDEKRLRPYELSDLQTPTELIFPISPTLLLRGHTDLRQSFLRDGVAHIDMSNENEIKRANKLICRFGYQSVYSQDDGLENFIAPYSDHSPTVSTEMIPERNELVLRHRHAFGVRASKIKYNATN